jgi:hypothetical protein
VSLSIGLVAARGIDYRIVRRITNKCTLEPIKRGDLQICMICAPISPMAARGAPLFRLFFANTHAPVEVAKARAEIERLWRDPRWQQKLVAGDPDARAQLENLSLRARAREDKPPSSPSL